MGRAIDMEKDIDYLKMKVNKLENTIRGMCSKLDELDDAIFDYDEDKTSMERAADAEEIVEEMVEEVVEEKKEKKDGKKANNKTSSSSSKRSAKQNGDNKKQNGGDGDSSK